MMTAGGIVQPGIEVGEGEVGVRWVVDVEDLKLMGCCVECNGSDMGRTQRDLLDSGWVDLGIDQEKRSGAVQGLLMSSYGPKYAGSATSETACHLQMII